MPQKAASYGMRVDENGAVFTESTDNLGKHTDYETKISDTDIAVSVNGTTHHLHNEMIANTMAQALMDASHHKKLLEKNGVDAVVVVMVVAVAEDMGAAFHVHLPVALDVPVDGHPAGDADGAPCPEAAEDDGVFKDID